MNKQSGKQSDAERANMEIDRKFYGHDMLLGSWPENGSPYEAENANMQMHRAFYEEGNKDEELDMTSILLKSNR